jgi:peroxiredoxin 5
MMNVLYVSRRRLVPSICLLTTTTKPYRGFHSSARAHVAVGDAIPDIELMENSPGNKVSIAKVLKGRGLIIGVPAAFSPACSGSHIPAYIRSEKLKDAGQVFVVR